MPSLSVKTRSENADRKFGATPCINSNSQIFTWETVPNTESCYSVSKRGEVRRNKGKSKRTKATSHKLLRAVTLSSGYMTVNLSVNGISANRYIHRLVAKAFVSNPLNLPEVNHKDGDKSNNSFTNLEWSTAKDNIAHADIKGLRGYPAAKLDFAKVTEARRQHKDGVSIKSLAEQFAVSYSAMNKAVRWETWKKPEYTDSSK